MAAKWMVARYGWLDCNEMIALIGEGITSRHCHQSSWPVLNLLLRFDMLLGEGEIAHQS